MAQVLTPTTNPRSTRLIEAEINRRLDAELIRRLKEADEQREPRYRPVQIPACGWDPRDCM